MSFLFFCYTFYTNFLCVILIFLSIARYNNYLNTSCRILSISFSKNFKFFRKSFYSVSNIVFALSFIILTSPFSKVNLFLYVSFSILRSVPKSLHSETLRTVPKVLQESNHLQYILSFPMELQYHYYLKTDSLIYSFLRVQL